MFFIFYYLTWTRQLWPLAIVGFTVGRIVMVGKVGMVEMVDKVFTTTQAGGCPPEN